MNDVVLPRFSYFGGEVANVKGKDYHFELAIGFRSPWTEAR